MNRHHWLEIAEYASLATSAAGTLAAVASQQVVYAAAPLTLTLSLNLANRHRFRHQTQHYASSAVTKVQQAVNSLDRQVQALLSEPVNLNPLTQSLCQLEQKTQQLTQQFDSRPETRAVTQLTEQLTALALCLDELPGPINSSIAQLQTQTARLDQQISDFPPPFDPGALEQRFTELEQKNANLRADYVKRLVPAVKRLQSDKAHNQEAIAKLTDQLNTLALRLDNLPSPPRPVDLSGIQGAIASLNTQLSTLAHQFSSRPETEDIERLTNQLDNLGRRLDQLPAPVDLSGVEGEVSSLNTQLATLAHQFSSRPETEDIERLTNQLDNLGRRLDQLPTPPKPVDLSGVEGEVSSLNAQLATLADELRTRPETGAVTRLTKQLDSLTQRLDHLPAPVDLREVKGAIANLNDQLSNLANEFKTRPERGAVAHLTNQLGKLARRLDQLPTPPKPVDLSGIQKEVSNLTKQLSNLSQQFRERPETEEVNLLSVETARLINQLAALELRLNNLPIPLDPVDLSGLEASITEINEALTASVTQQELDDSTRHFASVIEELKRAIADLPPSPQPFDPSPLTAQLENLTERLHNLPLITLQQHLVEANERIDGLDANAETLHDRTRNLVQMEQQLETVQQLTAGLDEKTKQLLIRTHNLDEMQQQLSSLRQLIAGYAKTEDLEGMLNRLRSEFSNQADAAIEKRLVELNQLLREIQPAYDYELVIDRSCSRAVLMEALDKTQQRLIIVNPWLTKNGIDSQVQWKFKTILNRQGQIDIGWGYLSDTGLQRHPICLARKQLLESSQDWKYDALADLEKLEQGYSKQFRLKLLGTHEKFLVCDNKFAMVGSHNVLCSGTKSTEREVGLRTNDPRIIADLAKRFDDAKNLEPAVLPANVTPALPSRVSPILPTGAALVDIDIPFKRAINCGTGMEMLQDSWEIEANSPNMWLYGK